MEKDYTLQADDWVELAENDPGPAIEMLKKIHRVQTAAELHPSLAFADRPWPSPLLGLSAAVIEQLRQARAIFMAKGFKVDSDPVNPLGDGKSLVLVVEPTRNLPYGKDPLEVAEQCQSECVKGAARPFWDRDDAILVALWDSGRIATSSGAKDNTPRESRIVSRHPVRKRSRRAERRDAVMFAAIRNDLSGIEYCRFLQMHKVGPLVDWVSEGCPGTLPEAYEAGQPWQQKIQDQKHKATKRMQRMEPEKFEGLLRKYKLA